MSPLFLGSPSGVAYRAPLRNGEQGTEQTVRLMRQLIDQALADSSFVRTAIDIVRGVAAYDEFGELESLYRFVKRRIRFTKDPVTKEKLYPPQELLKIRAGDCDDISMLLGALAMAVGYQARLITVSANPDAPQEFSHVYVEAEAPPGSGQWIPLDAARSNSQFGEEPSHYFRKKAWSLTDDSSQDLSGGRLRGALSGYVDVPSGWVNVPGLGDGVDLNSLITEIPAIISSASGGSSSNMSPYGSTQTQPANPYGSFATPYTPGYGVPGAGYGASGSFNAQTSFPWGLLLLGVGAFFLLKGRR